MKIRLEAYSTAEIVENWKVFIDEQYVGDVHNCDGSIGGYIGSLTESSVFDDVCAMAKAESIANKTVYLLEDHDELMQQSQKTYEDYVAAQPTDETDETDGVDGYYPI